MLKKSLKIKRKDKTLILFYGGKPFIKVTREEVFHNFLSDLLKISLFQGAISEVLKIVGIKVEVQETKVKKEVVKKKKVKRKKIEVSAIVEKKACKLAKQYISQKRKFYKRGKNSFKPIERKSDQFKNHFVPAAQMIIEHGVKIKTFLNAQVDGLNFVNDGIGTFPKPNQLSTDSAESRLMEYIRKQNFDDVHVELSEKDKNTVLQDNRLYCARYKKFNEDKATLKEALYIRECQLCRLDEVEEKIEIYLKTLRNKE